MAMEDERIVDLYWARSEEAILRTKEKYEKYLTVIADNILSSAQDSEECVSDTYLRAWNSMPENRPAVLSSYLGKITRHLAIDLYRRQSSEKRSGSKYALALDELEEVLGSGDVTWEETEGNRLTKCIQDFLEGRNKRNRQIFVSRYFYCDGIPEIAKAAGMKEVTVRSILFREREELKKYLEREGFAV